MALIRRLAQAALAAREHVSGLRDARRSAPNADEILQKVLSLPISTWSYTYESAAVERCGPIAQDFHEIFGYGAEDTSIPVESAMGVCLICIKVLARRLQETQDRLARLEPAATAPEAANLQPT